MMTWHTAAAEELGTSDFFGFWLLPNGQFLSEPYELDHRWVVDHTHPHPWYVFLTTGAIALRKSMRGSLNVRALHDHFYPHPVRQALESIQFASVYLDLYDEGFNRKGSYHGFEDLMLYLTDPILFKCSDMRLRSFLL